MTALLAENSLPAGAEGAAELQEAYDDVLAWALDPEKMTRYSFLNHLIHAESPDSLLAVAAAYLAWDTMRTWCVPGRQIVLYTQHACCLQ
jgi:hypothetical protein